MSSPLASIPGRRSVDYKPELATCFDFLQPGFAVVTPRATNRLHFPQFAGFDKEHRHGGQSNWLAGS
jgi:hypothetical protein